MGYDSRVTLCTTFLTCTLIICTNAQRVLCYVEMGERDNDRRATTCIALKNYVIKLIVIFVTNKYPHIFSNNFIRLCLDTLYLLIKCVIMCYFQNWSIFNGNMFYYWSENSKTSDNLLYRAILLESRVN